MMTLCVSYSLEMMDIKYFCLFIGLLVTIFIFGNWLHHSADVQASKLAFNFPAKCYAVPPS
jgi:hypothetical protein